MSQGRLERIAKKGIQKIDSFLQSKGFWAEECESVFDSGFKAVYSKSNMMVLVYYTSDWQLARLEVI